MKALFSRIRHGKGSGDKERDRDSDRSSLREKKPHPPLPDEHRQSSIQPSPASSQKPLPSEYSDRQLPPVVDSSEESFAPSWTQSNTEPVVNIPVTITSSPAPSKPPTPPDSQFRDAQPRSTRQKAVASTSNAQQNSIGSGDTSISKKVAFVSPPPTPLSAPTTRNFSIEGDSNRRLVGTQSPPPNFSAPVSVRSYSAPGHPRGLVDQTRFASGSSSKPSSIDTTRTAHTSLTKPVASPVPSRAYTQSALNQDTSLRSSSPFSQMTGRTGIQAAASWSEAAEEDLVINLGPRERTRQEVLWEIVASEDRYVVELLKLKETFIDPLLHPFASRPITTPTIIDPADDYYFRAESPAESLDNLPIASRFLSTNPLLRDPSVRSEGLGFKTPVIPDGEYAESDEEEDQLGRGYASGKNKLPVRSPYGTSGRASATPASGQQKSSRVNLPFPSRSHHSLPPPPRPNPNPSSTSLGRQSMLINAADQDQAAPRKSEASSGPASRMMRKLQKKGVPPPLSDLGQGAGPAPHLLPEDLRICLEVLEGGILSGHMTLSEGLKKRYEEQYPLVRSLADVFVTNSHILRGYATYVLHLERALEQVDNALGATNLAKKPKNQDVAEWVQVSKAMQRLEDVAAEKGETGLAISLSKPFQRLLKYPLLFQNLLFHTDPSTFEYESTLKMVDEVEKIVRSIEDEKIQKEERDKTRDMFARIDGLEKSKALAAPKASRQLLQERPLVTPLPPPSSDHPPSSAGKAIKASPATAGSVRQKSSFRRLSDVLQPNTPAMGGKKDLWLVVFNDVVLRCQRTGVTTLPLASSPGVGGRSHSLPELQGKTKPPNVAPQRRNPHTKPRNLYKFIKIETWTIGSVAQPRAGIVSMEDITRARSDGTATVVGRPLGQPDLNEEDEDGDSDDSDRKSKMSFSYWGADKITIQAPAAKNRGTAAAKAAVARRGGSATPATYIRESSANAKFGTRLRSPEPDAQGTRPASRRQAPTPTVRKASGAAAQSDDSHTTRAPSTTNASNKLPAWGSPGAARAAPPLTAPRATKLSTGSANAPRMAPPKVASPAPSEDSGVGFYRQMMAQDPSLNRFS